jgi:hypothetical protein
MRTGWHKTDCLSIPNHTFWSVAPVGAFAPASLKSPSICESVVKDQSKDSCTRSPVRACSGDKGGESKCVEVVGFAPVLQTPPLGAASSPPIKRREAG